VNIGFVVHHYDPADGTGTYAVELVTRLAPLHDVTLYAAAVRVPVPDRVKVVRVPALGGSAYARILSFPPAFAAVRRRHDVTHAQGWVTTSADIVTTHIVLGAWRDAARAAGVVSPPGERFLGGFVAAREGELVRQARTVIAPSARAAADISRCYGRAHGVSVVHHGFPTAAPLPTREEARKTFGLPRHAFIALYAGDARKGFDRAASALAGAPGVHLLVASRSKPDAYLAQADRLGVRDRIHWAGGLADTRPAFAAADVLLHPTIYDTFAMVVAEAMSYGVPVIVSREAGVVDLITHLETGWIIGPDETDAASALLRLKEDAALRERLATGGRSVANARSWNDAARETMSLYR
jgi:UDP-glucose:(heptosyl)LPS alpha-1,3-glucosyltransferase